MKNLYRLLIISLVLVSLQSYQTTFGSKGYLARQEADWWRFKYSRNCYKPEVVRDGKIGFWCKKNAFLQIGVRDSIKAVNFDLFIGHPDIKLNPVTVRYGGKDGLTHEMVFDDYVCKTLRIPVTRENVFEFKTPNGNIEKYLILSLDVSRTMVPKELGMNNDTRELGVAVIVRKEKNIRALR